MPGKKEWTDGSIVNFRTRTTEQLLNSHKARFHVGVGDDFFNARFVDIGPRLIIAHLSLLSATALHAAAIYPADQLIRHQ